MKKHYQFLERPYPRVTLHSETLRHAGQGHPWVTEDSFTKKFPKNRLFLIGVNSKGEEKVLLLNDPNHKNIKARVWSSKPPFIEQVKNFPSLLHDKFEEVIKKRYLSQAPRERENIYLIFGDADGLPGLFIQKLGPHFLIQYYSCYWTILEPIMLQVFTRILSSFTTIEEGSTIWIQSRNKEQEKDLRSVSFNTLKANKKEGNFTLKEFGIEYHISIDTNYDHGLYTDMSSIRHKLSPIFETSKTFLNLFSYTGAFSLYALKHGATKVTSVDLSGKYLDWLDRNLQLNPALNSEVHERIEAAVIPTLEKLSKSKSLYDFILCDPPSASSDGEKVSSAFKSYDKLFHKMTKCLAPNGHMMVFLNTHKISKKKFEDKISYLIKSSHLAKELKILSHYKLSEDCPSLRSFPEGDYLKGILIKRVMK